MKNRKKPVELNSQSRVANVSHQIDRVGRWGVYHEMTQEGGRRDVALSYYCTMSCCEGQETPSKCERTFRHESVPCAECRWQCVGAKGISSAPHGPRSTVLAQAISGIEGGESWGFTSTLEPDLDHLPWFIGLTTS